MSGQSLVVVSVVAVVLLLVTAYLAAVETVLVQLDVVRALRLDEEGRRGAKSLLWLTEHRASALNVVLFLTVAARVGLAALCTWLALVHLDTWAALAAAIAVVVALSLLIGEVVPRTAVLRHLEVAGLRLAGTARLLVRALDPPVRLVVALGRALVPRSHDVAGPYASAEEAGPVDDDEPHDEGIEPEERAMIHSIFELDDTIVREIMVPRPDMVTVPEDATLAEVVDVVTASGFSRLPVHAPGDPDTIVGVVYAKDLLARVASGARQGRWGDLVRPPTHVPETKRGDDLLRDLQAAAVHMAIVVDEYGELVGLVTIEDILEEIVGEIVDEHDHEEPLVEVLDDGRLRVDGRLGVDDLNELLDADLPEEGWDTVGGLVFATLGRVPTEGETIELDGLSLTVERIQGRRVGKVLVSRRSPVDVDVVAEHATEH